MLTSWIVPLFLDQRKSKQVTVVQFKIVCVNVVQLWLIYMPAGACHLLWWNFVIIIRLRFVVVLVR